MNERRFRRSICDYIDRSYPKEKTWSFVYSAVSVDGTQAPAQTVTKHMSIA